MLYALLLAVSLPDLVPARWPSADPKTLDRIRETPINCLLLEERHWSPEFAAAASEHGIALFGIVAPGADAAANLRKASAAKLNGVVLEGEWQRSDADRLAAAARNAGLEAVRLGFRSDIRFDPPDNVAGTFQGVWPGVQETAGDDTTSAPSGAPWIDTNSGFLRFVRAALPSPIWIANRPPEPKRWPVARYIQALGDAAMAGARWVISLDRDFAEKLLAGDGEALRDWKRIGQSLAFYEQHKEWRTAKAAGKLALIEDVASGALLSGGVLDMIAVKHTPVRPIPGPRLTAEAMSGARMAVNVDPEALSETQKEALKQFTRSGGTLLSGPPGWKFPTPRPGQIALEKADLEKLDQIWKEMNAMTGRRNLGARLFNVATMLSNLVELPDGRLVLHLVNYSDYDVENVTVHLLGAFRSATLLRPGEAPATVEGYEVEDGTGLDIDRVGSLAALVLTP